MVVLFRLEERFEIGFDSAFEIRLHGDGVKGGGVGEGNGSPGGSVGVGVDEETQVAVPLLDFSGDGADVVEVGAEDSASVGFSDLEDEGCGFVGPGNGGSEEVVVDGLVGAEGEDDVVVGGASEEVGEIRVLDGREGMQVEGEVSVEMIVLHGLVELWDSEELVDVEPILDGSPPSNGE